MFVRHWFLAGFLLLCAAASAHAGKAVVRIDPAREVGRLAPELFGQNVEWVGLCDGLLTPDGKFDAHALQAVRKLAPPVLRFPGGTLASTYDWAGGVGDPAGRALSKNYEGKLEPMRFGTGEFLDLAATLQARPLLTLNSTASPESSLAWVEYVKKRGFDPLLEFGNESYLKLDPSFMPAKLYVENYRTVIDPIKRRFPGIKAGAILDACMHKAEWAKHLIPEASVWNETVVKGTKGLADFYCVHLYAPMEFVDNELQTLRAAIAGVMQFEKNLAEVRALIDRENPGAAIWVTEHNVLTDKAEMNWRCGTAPAQATYLADLMMVMARARVAGAAHWSLLGNSNFGMLKNAKDPAPRPGGQLFEMLLPLAGAKALETTVESPLMPYKGVGVTPPGLDVKLVGAQAFEHAGSLFLLLTNRDLQFPMLVTVELPDKTALEAASMRSVIGPMNFAPGVEQTGRSRVVQRPGSAQIVLMPGGVTLVSLAKQGGRKEGGKTP